MSDFSVSWRLSRDRFVEEIQGLNAEQLNWHLHPGTLSIGETALHVAGIEIRFSHQLTGIALNEFEDKLALCGYEGVVNDHPFPFSATEITPELVAKALARSKAIVEPLIESATPDLREAKAKSVFGPDITGEGAFARLGFHAGYHHGQAYLIKTAPGFPKS